MIIGESLTNVVTQKSVLNAFNLALKRESHILKRRPELFWQQLFNRLQWEKGDIKSVLDPEFSKHCVPGYRVWFHNTFQKGESQTFQRLFEGHTDLITSCAISPDGKTLASTSRDQSLRIWDIQSGKEKAVLNWNRVHFCTFSPDGNILAVVQGENTVALCETSTYRTLRLIQDLPGEKVYSCAFSPDGKTLVVASLSCVIFCDVLTGEKTSVYNQEAELWGIRSMAISPSGDTIAISGVNKKVMLFSADTGQTLHLFEADSLDTRTLAFSPNGKMLASGSESGRIKLWDTKTGEQITQNGQNMGFVMSCAFSPDGLTLASTSSIDVHLWDIHSENGDVKLSGHSGGVYCCAFSPDGSFLISAGLDKSLRYWEIEQKAPIDEDNFSLGTGVVSCTYSSDGNHLATAGRYFSCMWDIVNQKRISFDYRPPLSFSIDGQTYAHPLGVDISIQKRDRQDYKLGLKTGHQKIFDGCFSPDGKVFATAGDTIRIWDVQTGMERSVLEGETPCAFSPDGRLLVSAGKDHTAWLWDVITGKAKHLMAGHQAKITDCSFSPRGDILATASEDHTIKLWNTFSGEEIDTFNECTDKVNCCAFSPDGKVLIGGGADKQLRFWDLQKNQLTHFFPCDGAVLSCDFHPSGKMVAIGDSAGNIYQLERIGIEPEPIIVTAIKKNQHLVVKCPYCQQEHIANPGLLNTEFSCPLSGESDKLQVNAFIAGFNEGEIVPIIRYGGNQLPSLENSGDQHTLYYLHATLPGVAHPVPLALTDDRKIILGNLDGRVGLWAFGAFSPTWLTPGHASRISCVAISYDNALAVSGSTDGKVLVWDLNHQRLIAARMFSPQVSALAIEPNGGVLVGHASGLISLWNLHGNGKTNDFTEHDQGITALSFLSADEFVSCGRDAKLCLWDMADNHAPQSRLKLASPARVVNPTKSHHIIICGCENGAAFLYDLQTRTVIMEKYINFSSDVSKEKYQNLVVKGSVLSAGYKNSRILSVTHAVHDNSHRIYYYDLTSGKQSYGKNYDDTEIVGGVLSPDGTRAVICDHQGRLFRRL